MIGEDDISIIEQEVQQFPQQVITGPASSVHQEDKATAPSSLSPLYDSDRDSGLESSSPPKPKLPPSTAECATAESSEEVEEYYDDDDYEEELIYENCYYDRFMFCHRCSNLLTLDTTEDPTCHRFVCATCPFYLNVSRRLAVSRLNTKIYHEEVDIDASKADQYRQRTEVICPECSNDEAFFYQMQTRSADEPMTVFYQCTKCKHNWRD